MERTEAERTSIDRQIGELTGVWLGRAAIGDRPYEELLAEAQTKAARKRRTAGARALVRKYGHEAATRIVANKTGRTIHFQ